MIFSVDCCVMFRLAFFPVLLCVLCVPTLVFADLSDCIWGGNNEKTTYTPAFVPEMGGVTLAQYSQPSMNLGAPQPAIPVQSTPQTRAMDIPQANIPTTTLPSGPVGSVGQPATYPGTVVQAPPGAEIVYIMPSSLPATVVCIDGTKAIPATEVKVVPAGTPGAMPAALKTVMVQRPKVEYHWTYAPIVDKKEVLVQEVNPRTGRVVRSYCQEEFERSTLPWLHRREVVSYETVEAKVAVPVSLVPSMSSSTHTVIQGGAVPYQSLYPGGDWGL
jgi:hypothetical protein